MPVVCLTGVALCRLGWLVIGRGDTDFDIKRSWPSEHLHSFFPWTDVLKMMAD